MIAARQIFLGRGGKAAWRNPYVTDGLVAMWDGEWNAGGGVHDQNATTWVDISGNGNNMKEKVAGLTFSEHALIFGGIQGAYWECDTVSEQLAQIGDVYTSEENPTLGVQYEICCNQLSFQNNSVILSIDSSRFGYRYAGNQTYAWGYIGQRRIGISNFTCFSYLSQNWTIPNVKAQAREMYYRDGVLKQDTGVVSVSSVVKKRIQNARVGATTSMTGLWIGEFYCARVYNRALTAAEIAANYSVDKQRFNLP